MKKPRSPAQNLANAMYQRLRREAHRDEINARERLRRQAHREERNAKNRQAYAANRKKFLAYAARYAATHREELCLRQQQYAANNPEKVLESGRKHDATHRDKRRQKDHVYRKTHRDVIRAQGSRRRAMKRNAPINDFTAAQWTAMKEAYGYRCVYCQRKMQRLAQDHIIPLIKGGPHTASNIVPACQSCNSKKGKGAPLCAIQMLLC